MKKFILIMFVALLIGLQLPFYTINGMTATINLKIIMSIFRNGITPQDLGTLVIYSIPILGVITSIINIFVSKNISLIMAIISVIGILYCGYIYFFVLGLNGSVNLGYIIEILLYFTILTMSIVSLRVKNV